MPNSAQRFRDFAALPHLSQEGVDFLPFTGSGSAARGLPNGRHHAADHEPAAAHSFGKIFQLCVAGIDRYMRIKQEQVDAIELPPVDFRCCGQVQHRVQFDARFVAFATLSDHTWPNGVMKLGKVVGMFSHDFIYAMEVVRWRGGMLIVKNQLPPAGRLLWVSGPK